jgi:TonB-linked SusC/RagA family outer membrane protein
VLGSVFSRVNYNYADRYLIAGTIRGDASSKFAKNHKWGYFPSVSAAWRASNEHFMSEQKVFSDLKLRVSYGQTGNSNIGTNAMALFSTGYVYNFGDQQSIGVAQSQLANPDLKWETTTEWNLGLDVGFLQNRITGSMELFTRRVSDLLDNRILMQYNPVNRVMSNIGAKGSRGFELGINSRNLTGAFSWSTDAVFSLYRDRWLERNPQWIKAIYENEKDMLNAYYLYLSDGLVQPSDMNPDGTCRLSHMPNAKPGMIKYKDLNGRDENGNLKEGPDGKLDDADIVYQGTKTSKFYAGLGNTFTYRGFDLNIFFYGYFGRKLENPSYDWYLRRSYSLKNGVNMLSEVKDRLAHDNPDGRYPTSITNPYDRTSDFWLENADFVRCKNITLGYTLPKISKPNHILQSLRIYGDVQNPFVITKYGGIDPEMDSMAAYPTQLTVSFGIDITF